MRRIGYAIIAVLAVQIVVVWFVSYRTTIHLTAMNGSSLVFEFHADDGSFSIANGSSQLRNTSLLLPLLIVLLWPLVEAALVLKRFLPKRPQAVKTEKAAVEEEAPKTPAAKSPSPTSPPASVPAASAQARSATSPSAATGASAAPVKSPAPAANRPAAPASPAASRPAAPATTASPAAAPSQAEQK